MKVNNAELKLDEQFNNMPGRQAVYKALLENDIADSVVDTDKPYWVNKEDTLVIGISANSMSAKGIAVAKAVFELSPDEFETRFDNTTKQYVCRFWWD